MGRRRRLGLPGAERGPSLRHRELPPRVPLQDPEPYSSPPVGVVACQAPLPPRSLRHRSQARPGVSPPDSPPGSPQGAASAARDAAGNQAPRAPASHCCAPLSPSAPNSFRPRYPPRGSPARGVHARAHSRHLQRQPASSFPPRPCGSRPPPHRTYLPSFPPFCFWPTEAFLPAAKFLFLFLEAFIQGLKPFYLPHCFVLLKCSIKKSFSLKLKYREWISKRRGLGLPVLFLLVFSNPPTPPPFFFVI